MIDQLPYDAITPGAAASSTAPAPGSRRTAWDSVAKARSALVPDHLVVHLLSKPWIDSVIPAALLVLIALVLAVVLPSFFDPRNLSDTARQWGEIGFLTLGLTVVILCGGIDLSVGVVYGLANFATIAVLHGLKLPVAVAMLVALLVGASIGAINGMLVGGLKMRAFLSTLAVLIIGRAVQEALALRYGPSLLTGPEGLDLWYWFGEGSFLGLPISLVLLLLAAAATHLLLTRGGLGWRIQAVGGSRRAAFNAGIRIPRTVGFCYVFSGMCAGMAGFLYSARTANPGAEVGAGFELIALSAAVLGGNSLGGGKGSAAKALLGALIVITVINAIVALGLRSGATSLALGLTLLCAVLIDARWSKNRGRILASIGLAPAYFEPRPMPAIHDANAAPYAMNRALCDASRIGAGKLAGPSDIAFDSSGYLYTVSRSGDLVRLAPPLFEEVEVFAHVGGQPMGLAIDADDRVHVCVYGAGLFRVGQDRIVVKLAHQVPRSLLSIRDDSAIRSAHAVDVNAQGQVFFCETTMRADFHSWTADALEMRGNGRLLCHDTRAGTTEVLARGLVFPSGVCLEQDGTSLLFSEAWACRISRYWLAGPRRGEVERVAENLPGFPSRITRSADGGYWVAMLGIRTPLHDLSMRMPGFRRRMARRVPSDEWLSPNFNAGFVLKLSAAGRVLQSLWDDGRGDFPTLTTVREHAGCIYLGGMFDAHAVRISLSDAAGSR